MASPLQDALSGVTDAETSFTIVVTAPLNQLNTMLAITLVHRGHHAAALYILHSVADDDEQFLSLVAQLPPAVFVGENAAAQGATPTTPDINTMLFAATIISVRPIVL